jgi:hypothetical protein
VITVAAGEYRVEFEPFEGNFLMQYWDHVDHWWAATPVTVAVGQTRQGIDADLGVGGKIEGTVRLSDGVTPVAGVKVCAWEAEIDGTGRCADSAADGTYSLDRLRNSHYKVEFSPPPEGNLVTQFWNRKAGWNSAEEILVSGEATITGVDAYLGAKSPPLTLALPLATPSSVPGRAPLSKCRKGFHRKLVKGKKRCVRKHRRHLRRHRSHH